jgi:hypothetical protein
MNLSKTASDDRVTQEKSTSKTYQRELTERITYTQELLRRRKGRRPKNILDRDESPMEKDAEESGRFNNHITTI